MRKIFTFKVHIRRGAGATAVEVEGVGEHLPAGGRCDVEHDPSASGGVSCDGSAVLVELPTSRCGCGCCVVLDSPTATAAAMLWWLLSLTTVVVMICCVAVAAVLIEASEASCAMASLGCWQGVGRSGAT